MVHYVGTLEDGTEFDSSRDREPLEFVLGGGMLIPGFEKAVTGKSEGETVTVTIPAAEAYGEVNPDHLFAVPRAEVPEDIDPVVGMIVGLTLDEGEVNAVISHVDENEVVLDVNHPLAGKPLNFEIEIVKITPH